MRSKKLNIPIYYGKLTIIQVKDLSKVEKKYGLQGLHGMVAFAFRRKRKNSSSKYYMVFEGKTIPSIIAHEALHMVGLIYEDINAILEIENDEPQCYLLGWIVGQCHKFLKVQK